MMPAEYYRGKKKTNVRGAFRRVKCPFLVAGVGIFTFGMLPSRQR
jgi:hypothetical protein